MNTELIKLSRKAAKEWAGADGRSEERRVGKEC